MLITSLTIMLGQNRIKRLIDKILFNKYRIRAIPIAKNTSDV